MEAAPEQSPERPVPAAAPAAAAPAAPQPPANPDEIIVAGQGAPPGDPAAAVNEVSFEAVQAVDKAVVAPIAEGYVKATPKPVRQGVHNALNNLSEPINFVNSLLQFKIGRAFRALGRFGINSTLGVAGLFDFAAKKPFKLRYDRNGFANTLGFYGIGAGPYMYLPLIGPTSTRDLVGRVLDLSLVPGVAGKPFSSPAYALGTGIARSLDDRVELDDFLRRLRSQCTNPYAAERDYYLAVREAEIAALRKRPFDLESRLPACLAEGPMTRVGQAVPPPAAAPAPPPAALPPAPAAEPAQEPKVTQTM
ncbi:MAG: VacJ family lipoprotein [Sphingomonadaceae bacterium]|nr:VacJ family lipoprotein [Sphingomonadaceae bacterium]